MTTYEALQALVQWVDATGVERNPALAGCDMSPLHNARAVLLQEAPAAGVPVGAPGSTDAERAAWLADKIVAGGDYAKEAAAMLRRWPDGVGVPDHETQEPQP